MLKVAYIRCVNNTLLLGIFHFTTKIDPRKRLNFQHFTQKLIFIITLNDFCGAMVISFQCCPNYFFSQIIFLVATTLPSAMSE